MSSHLTYNTFFCVTILLLDLDVHLDNLNRLHCAISYMLPFLVPLSLVDIPITLCNKYLAGRCIVPCSFLFVSTATYNLALTYLAKQKNLFKSRTLNQYSAPSFLALSVSYICILVLCHFQVAYLLLHLLTKCH